MFKFRSVRPSRSARKTSRRTALQARSCSHRASLEALEQRTVLSAVSWINPAGGAWDIASNWSTGAVPTSADDVTIDTASAITIGIQSSDNISVNSVTTGAKDTLSFSGGSLTVSAASSLDGPLAMTGGSLTASGSSARLIANGATTISAASLHAGYGGMLSLPKLTTYTSDPNAAVTLEAVGTGSVLDLSELTALNEVGWCDLTAMSGGELNLSSLTSLSNSRGASSINDVNNGRILDGNVTEVSGGYVSVDGSDPNVANSWKSLTAITSIYGGNYNLPALTNVDNSSFYVSNGASLSLPHVTSLKSFGFFQANGPHSKLDISGLTQILPSTNINLEALGGGTLDISGLASLPDNGGDIHDVGGSSLLDSNLKVVERVHATFDGTDPAATSSWKQFLAGELTVTGGINVLAGVTDIDGSRLIAQNGGTLSLPAVVRFDPSTFTSNVPDLTDSLFQADGAGSVLSLPALTTIATSTSSWTINAVHGGEIDLSGLVSLTSPPGNLAINDNGGSKIVDGALKSLNGVYVSLDGSDPHVADSWTNLVDGRLAVSGGVYTLPNLIDVDDSDLIASNGGRLALPGVTSYDAGGNSFSAQGAGSVLDVSAVSVVTNSAAQQPGLSLTIDDGGELKLNGLTKLTGAHIQETGNSQLLDGKLTTLDNVSVNLDGSDPNIANSWQTFTGGVLVATGGSASFPALTDIDGSNFYISGGANVAAPMVTSCAAGQTIWVTGAGSILDLSGLVQVTQKQAALNITVSTEGELKLTNLASLTGASHGISIVDNGHSSILDGNLAQLAGVDVSLDGSDPHVADAWTELTNGKLDIGGGGFTLPRLIDIDGSSLSVSAGGALSLPGLTSYASQGTFQATGNGVLDLPALASITQLQGDWSVSAASGGQVNLSGLTRLSGNGAGLFTVSFSGGGAILDGSLTSLDHVGITLDGVYPHLADSWVAFTNGSLTVTGGVYSLPNLKDADGSSLTATDGGSLALPGLTAYAAPSGLFAVRVSGIGSVLDLRALATLTCPVSSGISAVSGGQLNLSGLTSLDGGPNWLQIWETGDANILDPNLTSLNRVQIISDGTDPQIANSWTKLTSSALTVMGGACDWPNLADIDQSTLSVSGGGSLTLPGVTSYGTNGSFSADGQGSVLDLPALNSVSQQSFWNITAAHGGEIKLTSLTSLGSATPGAISISDTGNSRIVTSSLTALDQIAVTFDGTDPQMADAWSSFVNGKATLNGGAYDFSHLTDVGGSSLNVLGGGVLTLSSLANAENLALLTKGAGSSIELPNLTTFAGPASNVTVGDGGSIALAATTIAMPGAGAGLTIDVPQLPFDVPVYLSSTGSFNGATFNVGQGDAVNIADGMFTGTTTFNVEKQATLDLTGGNVVAYSGTLSGSGLGTVQLASGEVQVGVGGLSLNFPTGMFQWTGGAFDASAGTVTNQGALDLATAPLTIKGNFKNSGSLTLGPASTLAVDGNFTQTATGQLNEQIGGAPASGQFGQIAVQGQADLAGALNLSLVNGFTSSDNQDYKVLSFAAAHGDFSSASGLAPNFTEQFNPTSIDLATAIPTPYQKYVAAVYEDVLGRAPDSGGLAYWVKQLTGGASISSLAASIAHSDEYYANFVIKPDYLKLLGRAADDGSVTYWTAKMQAGLTDQQFEAGLIASDEFYKAAENFDSAPDADDTTIADLDQNTDWVDAVYTLLLGRTADSGGEAYWTKQLAAGISRGDVALSIANGAENNSQLINADYFHYLGRAADPDGLNYWLEQFAAGKTNEDVIAGFTGSLEYYEKHTN